MLAFNPALPVSFSPRILAQMEHLPAKLARYLRIAQGSEAYDKALPLWREALALTTPAAWTMRLPMEGFIDAFAPHAAISRDLGRTLGGCHEVVLMAATIGAALEERSDEHFAAGRAFAGYMLDKMGSYLVESGMRALHAQARQGRPADGLARECHQVRARADASRATRRYSPGYGDFALEAQAHFIRLIGGSLPGLTLTQGFILHPRKSVTAVCGLTAPPRHDASVQPARARRPST